MPYIEIQSTFIHLSPNCSMVRASHRRSEGCGFESRLGTHIITISRLSYQYKSKYEKVSVPPIRITNPFLTDEGPTLETLDVTIRISSTPTFSYYDMYLYSAYAAHYVYLTDIWSCFNIKTIGAQVLYVKHKMRPGCWGTSDHWQRVAGAVLLPFVVFTVMGNNLSIFVRFSVQGATNVFPGNRKKTRNFHS